MPHPPTVLVVLCVVLLAVVTFVGLYLSRTRTLSSRVGSFSCSVRHMADRSWTAGVAQYGLGRLDWYRTFSLSPRPAHSWQRSSLVVVDREPVPSDVPGEQLLLVHCRADTTELDLLMTVQACAGLVSWLEALPPQPGPAVV